MDTRECVGGVDVAVVCSTHGTSPPPSPSSSLLPPACITQLGAYVIPLPLDPRDRHARTQPRAASWHTYNTTLLASAAAVNSSSSTSGGRAAPQEVKASTEEVNWSIIRSTVPS